MSDPDDVTWRGFDDDYDESEMRRISVRFDFNGALDGPVVSPAGYPVDENDVVYVRADIADEMLHELKGLVELLDEKEAQQNGWLCQIEIDRRNTARAAIAKAKYSDDD